MSSPRFRIALVGPARFGIAEPCAGGLEAHTLTTARGLRRRGHEVVLFAGPGDVPLPPDLTVVPVLDRSLDTSGEARADTSMPGTAFADLERGYARVLDAIERLGDVDLVHNNSLHALPATFDGRGRCGVVHVLHCPPLDDVDAAHRARQADPTDTHRVLSVSRSLAESWAQVRSSVVWNGVDVDVWHPRHPARCGSRRRPTGEVVWAGRIVSEKAPHLAIDAARLAGRPIALAGPVQEPDYHATEVVPRLGPGVEYLGHLGCAELAALYAGADVGLVTPRWEEPFGLVAAELLACGTPVAGFDRGALPEVVHPGVGALAPADDVVALAGAIEEAAGRSRADCRRDAVERLSTDVMIDAYEAHYERAVLDERLAAAARPMAAG